MTTNAIVLSPIGSIRAQDGQFAVQIDPQYRPALSGLEGFSYVQVLWWSHFLDQPEERQVMECEQPYVKGPARLGIFATRSPMRPNPICLSAAPVIRVDVTGGVLFLGYIDAEDGTPVLDIKPYTPCSDRVRSVSVPDWCRHWPQWFEDSGEFDWAAEFANAR